MKSIQLTGYGKPHEVVKLIDVQDVGTPGPDEIIIDVEAAPIEPSDLYMIAGVYGNLPPLPHILGIQGVGRVAAKGRSVKHLKEGDRTMTPLFVPSWVDRVKTTASYLRPLPEGDVNQLAMLGINPATAYLLVTEYVQLKPGEWLLQNAANSSVGRAVIAIAKARGIKTVNIVRRAELIDEIKALGGDVVLVDGPDLSKRVAEATDKAPIRLALDGVGDSATQDLLNCIALYGTLVIWSGMSGKPFTASGPQLLFHEQTIRGMWIFNYFRTPNIEKVAAMYQELAVMAASGAIFFPVAGQFSFNQFADAIAVAEKFSGKAILTPKI
ncbi:MAG: zinc-dependent alcohol dehydrogenase family protein [Verrucomicrobia bacterium]|nr:zinc-dependent alcohol dehydrogenase family protein [Verrucomicrobiota bacterium]